MAWAVAIGMGCPIAAAVAPPDESCAKAAASADLTKAQALELGVDAYVYGYPLVTMEMTRRVMTNVATPGERYAPMGQLARMRRYPTARDRDVAAPNADTLYTMAWIDLSKEPVILRIPDMNGRYYLVSMIDGYTNVFQDPGSRTTGSGGQAYVITGPGWKGRIPDGMTEYKSPTNLVWIVGRIYSSGTNQNLKAARALQDQITLTPLSASDKPITPPLGRVDPHVDMQTPVRDQVNALDAAAYFKLLARLMNDNPPAATDAPMMQRMEKLGIFPGKDFNASTLSPTVAQAMKNVPKAAQEKIARHFKDVGKMENGWLVPQNLGSYGTDYLRRATVASLGLGATLPEDAIYPTSEVDASGAAYDGSNKYIIHIPRGRMPPVEAFWSLTLYDPQYFFVPNPLNRYELSERDSLTANDDGSVDIYVQKDNPGTNKESNWLPAPAGRFVLMLRMYEPTTSPLSILDGSWRPPPVRVAP